MSVELAGITLNRIHSISTLERADFVSHRVPGLEGNLVQNMGRDSVVLQIEGIFYGPNAQEDLEGLRDAYKAREPVDFLADIVGQAYFSQVVLNRFEVFQRAAEPEQFSYALTLAEYVPPPEPESSLGLDVPGIDAAIELEALDFMDMLQLPDLLSVPEFGDPTPPLRAILDGIGGVLGGLAAPADELSGLYGSGGAARVATSRNARAAEAPPAQDSLSGQLNTEVDDGNILQLIENQVTRLLSAGETVGDAQNQSASGIGALRNLATNILPPNLNRNDLLEQGFSSIRNLLPTDVSQALGGLDGQIDNFFGGLQTNLVGELGGILDNFSALRGLGLGMGGSLLQETGTRLPTPVPGATAARRDVQAVVSEIETLLDLLPNPLNVQSLLELVLEQLQRLPRERIPLQNLPVFDELRDKLETTLHWLAADGPGVSAHLAQSTQRLATYIRTTFYNNTLTPIRGRLEALPAAVNLGDLQTQLTATTSGINALAMRVRSGSIAGSREDIIALAAQIGSLHTGCTAIKTHWMDGDGRTLARELSVLDERLEEQMADLLLLSAPSTDLALVGLAALPFNQLMEAAGIEDFIGGIRSLFDTVANLVEMLNIDAIGATVSGVIDEATGAIEGFQNMLVNITVEFTLLSNRVEQGIEDLNIAGIVAELRGILEQFEHTIVQGINDLFRPIRDFLEEVFEQINGFVAGFDPALVIDAVLDLIRVLTDLLSNPTLLDTIARLKNALEDVNGELAGFSFRPVTDAVVTGIDVVKGVFEVAGGLPLPDSVVQKVSDVLKGLPDGADMHKLSDTINEGLEDIVEEGAKPALLAIKDKPAEFIEEVKKYSPDRYLGAHISAPYQAFLNQLEGFKPSALMQPVTEELNKALDELRRVADPTKLFAPLQEPYNTLYRALDDLDPQALVQPLQEKLIEGIQALTSRLPLDAADEAFAQVDSIAREVGKAVEEAGRVRDALAMIDARISVLSDAEAQTLQLGDDITNKLNGVSDFTPIAAAFGALEATIADMEGPILKTYLFQPLDQTIAQLEALDAQNRLIALVQAQRGFPLSQLNSLDASDEKTALLALLNGFNPMDDLFTGTLGGLQDRQTMLREARTRMATFFPQWQTRYFQPGGPLNHFRHGNLTLPELKTLLADTVREQLTRYIAPVFKAVGQVQALLAALLESIVDLMQRLEAQVNGLLSITEALDHLRSAIHGLVDQLEALDIMFIAREIQDVFDAVKAQLEALNPETIGNLLKTTFDHLLDALNPATLLGLSVLDGKHGQLVALLRERDPGKLLTDAVQPEFDKVLDFLRLFDISEIITVFLQNIEALQTQLATELDRTVTAYDSMIQAIPDRFDGQIGASFSVG